MAGFIDPIQPNSAFGTILRSLSQISRFGMKYEDMVVRNSQAIGKTESEFFNEHLLKAMLSTGRFLIPIQK